MKVLVTGGAGYIGSHIVTKLLKKGYAVCVYDNLSTGFKESLPEQCELVIGDVRDFEKLSNVVLEFCPDMVIHMAAKLSVPESFLMPMQYYETNVLGMINLLKACENVDVKGLVFSSTAAVYGNTEPTGVYSEKSRLEPTNPYGKSKMCAEMVLQDVVQKITLKAIVLRYFNVAGAALDGSNGQRSAGQQLIKKTAEVAAGVDGCISIYGDDYDTADGTCVRDYIHVEDLAEIHVQALESLKSVSSEKVEVINCGYGCGYSVYEIIDTMKKVTGVKFSSKVEGKRLGDTSFTVSDNSKLKKKFSGWHPKYNDLEIICRSAYNWENKRY